MLVHLVQSLLHTQGFSGVLGGLFDCKGCSASAFTAISAAMSTQGYWAQSDILNLITNDNLGHLAVLMYVLAAIAGIIGMALGMPPKLYLMLFMGPGLYDWLVATKVETAGVVWEVGKEKQNQGEVWKLAYPGIQSTRTFQDGGIIPPSINLQGATMYLPPMGTGAKVSWLFAEYDAIVSDFVQNLIRWFGIYSSVPNSGGLARFSVDGNAFHLMSNLKWGMLETITSAKITDAALRDVFITFLSSECGDRFRSAVNLGALSQANGAKGKNLPNSVFWGAKEVTRAIDTFSIPTPFTMGNLFRDGRTVANSNGAAGSFLRASQLTQAAGISGIAANGDILSAFGANQYISCSQLLYSIVVGLRWESGHTYAKLIGQAPALRPQAGSGDLLGSLIGSVYGDYAMTPGMVVDTLFYGWEVPNGTSSNGGINWENFGLGGSFGSIWNAANFGTGKDSELKQQFLLNLITAYIIKNEFAIAPPITPTAARTSAKEDAEKFSSLYASTVGSKSKFGELYVWALMVPYLQGVFLYFLAIAYPFVCMAMVVPGWHTMLFSWMAFWAWVKLWDVGFAIVQMAERSIWGMIGNSSDAAQIFGKVAEMTSGSSVSVSCQSVNVDGVYVAGKSLPCIGSQVVDVIVNSPNGHGVMTLPGAIKTLDLGMLLGASLDLERANSYYIYLMAALYFAVPVVTGQIVLGSKAAAAGMVKDFIGGAASDGGRAAGSAFSAQKSANAQADAASQAQAAMLKGLRSNAFATGSIAAGNQALRHGLESSYAGAVAQGLGSKNQQYGNAQQFSKGSLDIATQAGSARYAAGSALGFLTYPSRLGDTQTTGGKRVALPSSSDLSAWGQLGSAAFGTQSNEIREKEASKAPNGEGKGGSKGINQKSLGLGFAGASAGMAASGSSSAVALGASGGGDWLMKGANLAAGGGGFFQVMDAMREGVFGPHAHAMNTANAFGNAEFQRGYAALGAEMNALQAGQNVASFAERSAGDGYNKLSNNLSSAANFSAAQNAWLEKTNAAQAVNPYLSALGASPAYSGGEKPVDITGGAYVGQLGLSAQKEARYADEGGAFFNFLNGKTNDLNRDYGYASILSAYNNNALAPSAAFGAAYYASNSYLQPIRDQMKDANSITGPLDVTLLDTGVKVLPRTDAATLNLIRKNDINAQGGK